MNLTDRQADAPDPAPCYPAGMVVVTREQFFAYVNPRDIVLDSQPDFTVWETRGRVAVGRSYPGYARRGNPVHLLTTLALAALAAPPSGQ